jgi:hypothetical protein
MFRNPQRAARLGRTGAVVAVLLAAAAGPAGAQTLSVVAGAYVPASDFYEIRQGAQTVAAAREAALAVGVNLERGLLRASLAWATGATLTEEGVENGADIGDGSVLAGTLGVVVRPVPRIVVQPYALAGVGAKRQTFSLADVGARSATDLTLQIGIGADLVLGPLGLVLEVTDYISRRPESGGGQHDAFVLAGIRFRL